MSAPSHHAAYDKSPSKRKDRPPALEILDPSKPPPRPDDRHVAPQDRKPHVEQLRRELSNDDQQINENAHMPARSASATSSLDPYYFSVHSPADSSPPPLPDPPHQSRTPETRPPLFDPVTPHKDPASIDRRGLHGLGELATPRWTRSERNRDADADDRSELDEVQEEGETSYIDDQEDDAPDSPWTIEAIDGEDEERDEPTEVPSIQRTIRPRPSVTEESGGEEIVYPRKPQTREPVPSLPSPCTPPGANGTAAPPSAFLSPMHKAKKRTSDEFERDQSGTLIKKHQRTPSGSIIDKSKEDKASTRKHRSLGVGLPSSSTSRDRGKDRRRESVSTSAVATPKNDRHVRQTSASSSSSSHGESLHSRRVHTTDFSHLPPSPSTSSIQQFLRHAGSNGAITTSVSYASLKETQAHHSPNVAHSLLRGTQEGWSDLDDQATAEALRKLDGLSGKAGTRVRSSVGSLRAASSSRPGTPAKSSTQWEGVGSDGGKASRRSSTHARDSMVPKEKEPASAILPPVGLGLGDFSVDTADFGGSAIGSSDDTQLSSPAQEKPVKKNAAGRLSYTAKRGSTSSTNYTGTPTTSSRDSGSLSTGTSLTSASAQSGRHSTGKVRRNSGGSDISSSQSNDVTSLKDRAASLAAAGETAESGETVPPVPPLPKDLATYRSPPHSSTGSTFPLEGAEDQQGRTPGAEESDFDRTVSLDAPPLPSVTSSPTPQTRTHGNHDSQGYMSTASAPAVLKTPSKKWSFSSALGMKLGSSSPAAAKETTSSKAPPMSYSPRSATFGQARRSGSKDRSEIWSPSQPEAMGSAASLASQSSLASLSPPVVVPGTPDRHFLSSRPGTAGSASQLAAPQPGPLSPSGSVRRGSSKRLTPSSIPFFRRSSSQSMQVGSAGSIPQSLSPTASASTGPPSLYPKQSASPIDSSMSTPPAPTSAHKKTSMLGLGSLLKGSSSKRNLHGDKSDAGKSDRESRRGKDTDKEKSDKEKAKKDDKDRSESRISVLMGRRRGKTVSSSAEPKKAQPVSLPPMQMSLPQATAQRVANLKAVPSSSNGSAAPARSSTISARATAQTISSLQRQSDTSLRSRTQLPTIAGSPSVGTAGSNSQISKDLKDLKDMPPPTALNALNANPKETPTKIPRIHSRTSTVSSPALKASTSSNLNNSHRASLIVSGSLVPSAEPSPTPGTTNEFGVLDNGDTPKSVVPSVAQRQQSVRSSPLGTSSRATRTAPTASSSAAASGIPRKGNRESLSFAGLRKSSTGSVASISSVAPSESQHRFSALSPSKGLKLLTPKSSLPHSRSSTAGASGIHQAMGSPSTSRQSFNTPSPAPSSVDEEELVGDEEMLQYIKRQQQKKLAHGATQEELDGLLRFPEPLPPVSPRSPAAILKSSQRQYLSEYELQEIQDFPSVYYIGANSEKKPARPDVTTNNFGYDDDRGDYLVVDHDHLNYRYEVLDSLGKGSFGQVLSCRDHCTGQSVAVKIIRNKKRFHHQALVEIKILDNLRTWDSDEKHHVIKMTEHFYFRNHLCIAMELLSINLYELIKANGFVGFTTGLIRRFTSQMLMSLTLMRHHRIVHCDLKPENVLLRHPAKSAIKVIDFGSSCFEHEKIYTYIQSRFYRSPEVILGMNYHMAIDMWSLGCILAELKTGFPIFPGENEQEQLSCIMEVLGVPDKDFVNRSSRKRLFFDSTGSPRPVVNSKGRRRRPGTKTLAQVLRTDDDLFVDFISKCLMWDPERRIKPQAALRHAFLTQGKRSKPSTPSSNAAKALLTSASNLSSRTKPTETPKKSQISAPTPLTARVARTTNANPSTPSGSTSMHTLGSARSYRTSQSQAMSSHYSSRTLNGFATTSSTK
ncbi:hypothetical protein FA95DRAFT_1609296 [Auriscalpium vulgare]|uniref:Uncharacterized protein n=1 Tax=Auriscalpium vulgare TaxID=40419 RepID=A0ACB8RHH6_9AGAM|nr:hypothetical protein FA95DRAFT_1609296 [Auriscalpium vulgare]